MKVLYHSRNPRLWIGGDNIQVENTMAAIDKLGVNTYFTSEGAHPYNHFDLVHVFHINFFWTKMMLERLQTDKKPYVISSIFFPREFDSKFHEMRRWVDNSKATIALSQREKEEMVETLGCNPEKITVIPNGVDKSVFKKSDAQVEDRVISIGRLQPMKGAHLLIEACHRLKLKLCYISSEGVGEYAQKLIPFIDEYYENIPQDQVAYLLQTSRLYVCPSLTERQSLGVLEAAACGCPIVDSVHNRGNSLLPSSVIVDPENIDQLTKAIEKQWNAERNTDDVPGWLEIGKQILDLYKQ